VIKLRIDLLRHGETTLSHTLRGHLDDPLTEMGWQQMQSTIQQHMASKVDTQWDVIISSPLQRCRCFAEQLVEQLKLPLAINPQIKEMDFGDWEGISIQKIFETAPELLANFWQYPTQFHAPNAETFAQFQQRILTGFEQVHALMQAQQYQSALVVTHGGVIKLLSCLAQQQSLDDVLKMPAAHGQLYPFKISQQQQQLHFAREI
jgi:alpha-ribazole phosphatase